jgi:hypothetical protein
MRHLPILLPPQHLPIRRHRQQRRWPQRHLLLVA